MYDDDEDDYPHLDRNPLGLTVLIVVGVLFWGAAIAMIVGLLAHW